MTSSTLKKWLPGLLFLSAQLINTLYELTQDTRTLSWAPHTTQVFYRIDAFENGQTWEKQAVESRYSIAQSQWEAHASGNLRRLVESVEAQKPGNPDSVRITYRRNGAPERTYLWKASR
ncbi:hypothetical protein SAMN04487996_105157 [Dyadobacter soli]|uniref:Uncharacterized protein n=1 Tax=Dyadobacter soli TaxID=659014 RepID=A0A1G7DAA7_9BACT|nr:hypothetical protein [Dyadobacter soli]SDE47920.1 hypothetical protein SAMN04487996_105157 [Dyadobacter soli]